MLAVSRNSEGNQMRTHPRRRHLPPISTQPPVLPKSCSQLLLSREAVKERHLNSRIENLPVTSTIFPSSCSVQYASTHPPARSLDFTYAPKPPLLITTEPAPCSPTPNSRNISAACSMVDRDGGSGKLNKLSASSAFGLRSTMRGGSYG